MSFPHSRSIRPPSWMNSESRDCVTRRGRSYPFYSQGPCLKMATTVYETETCSADERILDLFTKVSHHCDVTCIYLTQNLFPPGKFSRIISLNAHYIIAFNNPRDTLGFRTLAQQAFAGQVPYVWESFQDATSQPHGYLMLDLHPRTPVTLRLRSNILPLSQTYSVVYVNKKTHKTNDPLAVDCS